MAWSSYGTHIGYRHYFAKKFDHIVAAEMAARAAQKLQGGSVEPVRPWPHRFTTIFRRRTGLPTVVEVTEEDQPCHGDKRGGIMRKLRPDMIRRMDDAPRPVDPSGWISEGQSVPMKRVSADKLSAPLSSSPAEQVPEKDDPVTARSVNRRLSYVWSSILDEYIAEDLTRADTSVEFQTLDHQIRYPVSVCYLLLSGHIHNIVLTGANPMQKYEAVNTDVRNQDTSTMPRTTTVEFALAHPGRRERPQVSGSERSGAESLYADDRSKSLNPWLLSHVPYPCHSFRICSQVITSTISASHTVIETQWIRWFSNAARDIRLDLRQIIPEIREEAHKVVDIPSDYHHCIATSWRRKKC